MKIQKNNSSIIFSDTKIPDVFFTEYFSEASGDFIKVYLYINFLSKYCKEIKINDLSKKLSVPFPLINEALKYWEDKEVLLKTPTGYIVTDLQEKELNKLYKVKVTSSPEDIKKNQDNKYRSKAIENINTECFQGVMSPSWYNDIDFWFSKYGFDEQVMIALFRYCFERSALNRQYISVVADAWGKNNIKTFTDLDLYYQKQDKLKKINKEITKKLGISRQLTQYEEAYIEKWIVEYSYSLDIIEIALKRTTSKANPSFDYIDKLLSDWHDRNFKTVSDIKTFLDEFKQKNNNIKNLEKKSKLSNYSQRDYNNLNSLYANMNSASND